MVDFPQFRFALNIQIRGIMDKSLQLRAVRPNWYRGLHTKDVGEYYGSLASLYPDEVFVTFDKKWIVTRTGDGKISVVQNVCLHAGAEILNTAGTQHSTEIRCSVHQWLYDTNGRLVACPKFTKSNRALARPAFGVWKGFALGYSPEELRALDGFGAQLSLPADFLSAEAFWFGEEIAYKLPYPRPLMKVNYDDGLHVAKYHEFSFGPMTDESSYLWEFGANTKCSYSIQVVHMRPNLRAHVDRLMRSRNRELSELGWADLHFWLEEKMPGAKTPIDKNIFAVWASIYGNGYVMPELYEGGRLLALSYLVEVTDEHGIRKNANYVEFYIHKCVPEELRAKLLEKFIFAYRQSADEDDELCMKLWAAHRRNDIDFDRIVHGELEAGEAHFRTWFIDHFVA